MKTYIEDNGLFFFPEGKWASVKDEYIRTTQPVSQKQPKLKFPDRSTTLHTSVGFPIWL